jgi:acetyl-CoA acetyltransferase
VTAPAAKAAIVGVGVSDIARHADVPVARLALDAALAAIDDAGLSPSDIDGVATVPGQPFGGGSQSSNGVVTSANIARALKLDVAWMSDGDLLVVQSLVAAAHAVASGTCRNALVFRALHNPRTKYGASSASSAAGNGQFVAPFGIDPPAIHGLFAARYLNQYALSRGSLGAVAIAARRRGLQWEHGYWARQGAGELTLDDYLQARMIAEPLNLFDCDIPIDGAAAFVLTSAESAAHLVDRPAYILGMATSAFRPTSVIPTLDETMELGRGLAGRLWRNAGAGPQDLSTANIYDGFSVLVPMWLDALGFYPPGESLSAIESGDTGPGAARPLNTSGGNLGGGRLHGVAHILESVLQVTGRAGKRQLPDVGPTLCTVGGLVTVSGGVVMAPSRSI